jgi:predicted RNase H-like nuclease (RuvC/YqgF family)
VTVLDSHVPARYVKNGYTILSNDGRILEVVPRALTEEEIRERDRLLAVKQQEEKEEREQKIADHNLLRIYSTPEDVIRARDTKIASVDNFIKTSQGNLQRLEIQKRNLASTLADIERAGGAIPKGPLNRIRNVDIRIRTTQREIGEKRMEMEALEKSFATDLQRVRQLYGSPDS